MDFSDSEIATIHAARSKIRGAKIARIMMIIAMLLGLGGLISGVMSADVIAYWMLALVIFGIAQPQFGPPPKYEDLADLLQTKLEIISSTEKFDEPNTNGRDSET